MFKNLVPYKYSTSWSISAEKFNTLLEKHRFTPCKPTDFESAGWNKISTNMDYIAELNCQWYLTMQVEKKILPAAVIKRALAKKVDDFHKKFQRYPTKKEKKELQENVELELLPKAFSKFSIINVWIDTINRWVGVDTSNRNIAERIAYMINMACSEIELPGIRLVALSNDPSQAMTDWLVSNEAPPAFTIDDHCELVFKDDDTKPKVRYDHHSMERQDIKDHIAEGKTPVKLAMTYDDAVSFVLCEDFSFKKIVFLKAEISDKSAPFEEQCETQFTLASHEFGLMLNAMLDVMGGEDPAKLEEIEEEKSPID